jgi:SH3-like domain-containing protein
MPQVLSTCPSVPIPDCRDVKPYVVEWKRGPTDDSGCEWFALLFGEPGKVRREDRGGKKSRNVLRIGRSFLQPALNISEPSPL